jgi:hypothetical protein
MSQSVFSQAAAGSGLCATTGTRDTLTYGADGGTRLTAITSLRTRGRRPPRGAALRRAGTGGAKGKRERGRHENELPCARK